MTTPVNNRLLIIRDSITDAKQLITDRSQDFDHMKALWLADLAVDMMLATIVSHLSLKLASGKPQRPMFEDLEKTVFDGNHSTLSGLLSHQTKVNTIHNQRNRIQHDGLPPSLTTARDCVYGAENFLKDAFKNVFSVDLETFSLSDFITLEKAKEHLKEAEKHFENGDYTECAWMASQAFAQGKREFYTSEQGEGPESYQRYSWVYSLRRKGQHNFDGSMQTYENQAVVEIAEALELSRFGLDLHLAIAFLHTAPIVQKGHVSEHWERIKPERTFSLDEAKFILRLSTEALYRMQTFTSNYWLPK